MRLLIVEDDPFISELLSDGLSEEGYECETVATAAQGEELARLFPYGLLILDVMLPEGIDAGFQLGRRLREHGVVTPILYLTARGAVEDRIQGLDAGGDDYLVKPFAMTELIARIDALARRPHLAPAQTKIRVGELEIDLLKRSATRAGRAIDLQAQEFKLLEYLMRHAGQIVTRTMLLENVWSFHFDPQTNIIEGHVSRLRAKIDRGFGSEMIKTVRGAGYMIDAPA